MKKMEKYTDCCCVDVHAGGSFLKITRFVVFEKNSIFLSVDVALRATWILKNHSFCIYLKYSVAKHLDVRGFEDLEYARTLSFEKCCRMH